jgi:phage gp16-like protein
MLVAVRKDQEKRVQQTSSLQAKTKTAQMKMTVRDQATYLMMMTNLTKTKMTRTMMVVLAICQVRLKCNRN